MCESWYLILRVLFHINWYPPQWNSSIHLATNFLTKEVTMSFKPQGNYVNIQIFKSVRQPHFENVQRRRTSALKLLLKFELEFKLVFIRGVRTRQTPRNARTLDAKYMPPGRQVDLHGVTKPSWDCQHTERKLTESTNSIITRTGLSKPATELPTSFPKKLNTFNSLFHLSKAKLKRTLPCSRKTVVCPEFDRNILQFSACKIALSIFCSVCNIFKSVFTNLECVVNELIVEQHSDHLSSKDTSAQLLAQYN